MKYIGNIFTSVRLDNVDYYNVVDDKEKLIDGIPTLIIGWSSVKSLYPNADIMDWKIDNNTYWTFGKRERREKMELDIPKFKKLTRDCLTKKIRYMFFNILTEKNENKERLYNSLKDSDKKTVYIDENMVYILYDSKNKVIGISLRDIEYIGGNIDKLLSVIKSNDSIKFLDNSCISVKKLKYLFKNNLYIIPYVLSE